MAFDQEFLLDDVLTKILVDYLRDTGEVVATFDSDPHRRPMRWSYSLAREAFYFSRDGQDAAFHVIGALSQAIAKWRNRCGRRIRQGMYVVAQDQGTTVRAGPYCAAVAREETRCIIFTASDLVEPASLSDYVLALEARFLAVANYDPTENPRELDRDCQWALRNEWDLAWVGDRQICDPGCELVSSEKPERPMDVDRISHLHALTGTRTSMSIGRCNRLVRWVDIAQPYFDRLKTVAAKATLIASGCAA